MKDYCEPWTYEYDELLQASISSRMVPTAHTKSKIAGERTDEPKRGPN